MTRLNRRAFNVSALSAAMFAIRTVGEEQATARTVHLTLDDGPHPTHTRTILDVLKAAGAKATFFVLGANVRQHGTDLLKRAVDEGHGIGNHTWSHKDLTKLEPDQVREEISRCEALIKDFLPKKKLFRPPYGATNPAVEAVAAELGYKTILWNVDTIDWNREYQPDRWVRQGLDKIRNEKRCVVLMHDIQRTTADNFAKFVEGIQALPGTKFVGSDTL